MAFDPEEIVTLSGQGKMRLRAAVERVMARQLRGLDATIFREGNPSNSGPDPDREDRGRVGGIDSADWRGF